MLQETKRHKKIKPEEILHCIGLLVVRMLCPHKHRFVDHWANSAKGAVPKGTFGRFMSKARFTRVMQNLHFTDNTDARAETDRAWKVNSVVDTLQTTFRDGYNVPPVLAFDEAMIPSRSRHNVTRQFMKDKPHKWGTKLFMTCCADTAYCLRLEHLDELGGESPTLFSADPNSGPTAVIRNLQHVLPPPREGVYHAVITDRFYTSVQLAMQLLARNVYSAGTIQTNKKGFPPALVVKTSKRPADIPRGTATIAVAKCCPKMQAMLWWDRLPVYLLSTGSSTKMETCGRRLQGGERSVIPCPSAMRDYHRWVGGVDIHDQLRLQRYSLQLSVRFKKYYKAIFLGLIDIAIVNSFIVYRECIKKKKDAPADHARFLQELQAQLLQVNAADFTEAIIVPDFSDEDEGSVPARHKLVEFPEWVQVREGVRKRPQHQCKVCSIRKQKVGQRSATRFFCEACNDGNKRVYLCDRVRPNHYPGNNLTCHQIWHVKWKNGDERPRPRVGRDIQMRGLGKKRRCGNTQGDAGEDSAEVVEEELDADEEIDQDKKAENSYNSGGVENDAEVAELIPEGEV
ncbi:Hypothetical protein PHPALM_4252 [Phytophthora palmivora]|uniref:PiggyBac transposable element-derived protein domain-containing protein n=1 Tax=Phytophthora palmivora TaxID=4796 RepID=A0A2P4YK92_9STRA|nr:Hypothetical protein PHPALM_4252 [Phytophthora palmivora]